MIFYHGTNKNFKTLDVNKTSEYGVYFGSEKVVAESYGVNIHKVTLNYNNLCDLTTIEGVKRAIEVLPETFMAIIDDQDLDADLTVDELIEDELEACLCALSNSSVCLNWQVSTEICLRDELLKALKKSGNDAVLLRDYTDGDNHDAYVVFNNDQIQY